MATRVCFIDIPPKELHRLQPNSEHTKRGLSPMSISSVQSSPRNERNMSFFCHLSRRFGLKSSDDLGYAAGDDDSYPSSSTDSCSSTTDTVTSLQMSLTASMSSSCASHSSAVKDGLLLHQGSSSEHLSCTSSNISSNVDINDEIQMSDDYTNSNSNTAVNVGERKLSRISRSHHRSTSSIFKMFESILLPSARSQSCSGDGSPPQRQLAKQSGSGRDRCGSGTPPKSALKTASALELRKRPTASSATSSAKSKSTQQQPPQRILRQPVSYI